MTELHHAFDTLKKSLGGIPLLRTLSGRLLWLTITFVMLAEILIYVPSIANFRETWLEEKLAAAQIASLAKEATMGEEVKPELEEELLNNAGALQVSLQRNDRRILMLSLPGTPMADATFDLREASALVLIRDAFHTLYAPRGRIILIKGMPGFSGGASIEVLIEENALKDDMLVYSRNILTLSIIISIFTASLLFWRLRSLFVKPMNQLAKNMLLFKSAPEDASRIINPKSDVAEIRMAEQELATLQSDIRNSLNQKTRLAALGTAVSKINHDLRNILASAQLMSDTLASSDDPKVQRLAPKLLSSIDRAVNLATNTLKYGKAEEPPPNKVALDLAKLVDEVGAQLGLPDDGHIHWINSVPADMQILADPDQLFRIIFNLGRNAYLAIETSNAQDGSIEITAGPTSLNSKSAVEIDVIDTGPGFAKKAREHLFEAFSGSARQGGTGLGLAIAKELTLAHGGTIELVSSSDEGTTLRIKLPNSSSEGKEL